MQRLVKAKSEQSLVSTSESASLSRKSKSLEPRSKMNIWSCEPTEVQLVKGTAGLGFSILDDPVSHATTSHRPTQPPILSGKEMSVTCVGC